MKNAGGWLQGVQYFRAIAIIEVVLFHVTDAGAAAPNPNWVPVVLRAFTSFGVPHFIFISGVVLYNRYNNGFSLSTFYKKRFNAVIPPYLIWSTLYFAVFYVIFAPPAVLESHQRVATLATAYLRELATGYQHLWFIIVLVQLYLLYPLLEKCYNRATRKLNPMYLLSLLLVGQIGYVYWKTAFPSLIAWYLSVLSYVFYFVFGFFVARHYETITQWVVTISLKGISLVVLAATIYYVPIFYYAVLSTPAIPPYIWLNIVTGPLYCLVLILFYLRISVAWGEPRGSVLPYVERIGEDSFGIFLIHWFFLWAYSAMYVTLGISVYNPLLYPVLFVLTFGSSFVVVEAIYRLPFSNVIIGARRKRQPTPTAGRTA